ncbi:MAG: VCBS repeat-containing protein [Saprospiraceae bacterium]|nr:VCBS repeat-containing protein [Saprospiraceae bacterium]
MNQKGAISFSFLPLCISVFLIGFQTVLAQDCKNLDTSACFINNNFFTGPFQLEMKSSSIVEVNFQSHISLADITGDCHPEIILIGLDNRILILNPVSGDTIFSIPFQSIPFNLKSVAIADVDNDQIPELL